MTCGWHFARAQVRISGRWIHEHENNHNIDYEDVLMMTFSQKKKKDVIYTLTQLDNIVWGIIEKALKGICDMLVNIKCIPLTNKKTFLEIL